MISIRPRKLGLLDPRKKLALPLVLVAAVASACGTSGTTGQPSSKTLTVLAASSLKGTFTELAGTFEDEHPGVQVRLVFDSSATLAQSTIEGAPGDVLATADEKTAKLAESKGGTGARREFATNVLQLAVPAANPAGINSFADLDSPRVKYVTCVPTAPCGAAAQTFLAADHIARKPVSQEVDVKAVLAKVTANEADAGLVYRTDVKAAGKAVQGIDVPGADKQPNTYWIAVTKQDVLASDWVDLVTGETGQQLLQDAGFGAPGA